MFRRSLKTFFALLLVFVLSSAALALQPQDSISARPEGSIYTVLRVDDTGKLLWAAKVGDEGVNQLRTVAVTPSASIIVSGVTFQITPREGKSGSEQNTWDALIAGLAA